jgi:hypothetical protein
MKISKPTVRKAESLSGNTKTQEAKAVSRKTKGIHNLTDRANSLRPKPADMGLVSHPKNGVKEAN